MGAGWGGASRRRGGGGETRGRPGELAGGRSSARDSPRRLGLVRPDGRLRAARGGAAPARGAASWEGETAEGAAELAWVEGIGSIWLV